MTTIERLMLLCNGGIMLSAVFVFYQFFRLVLVEFKDRRSGLAIADNKPLSFSLWLCLGSIGIFGSAAARVNDGLQHQSFSGSTPYLLTVFLLMVWISSTGFHWLASRKRKVPWHLYVGCVLIWLAVVAWPLVP